MSVAAASSANPETPKASVIMAKSDMGGSADKEEKDEDEDEEVKAAEEEPEDLSVRKRDKECQTASSTMTDQRLLAAAAAAVLIFGRKLPLDPGTALRLIMERARDMFLGNKYRVRETGDGSAFKHSQTQSNIFKHVQTNSKSAYTFVPSRNGWFCMFTGKIG